MPDLISAIAQVRHSVGAVLKIHPTGAKDTTGNPQYTAGFVGTAFCLVANTRFLTAHHVFNLGKPRDPIDKFVLFICQDNGPRVLHVPITQFGLEDAATDMTIFDATIPPGFGVSVQSLPVVLRAQPDGTPVLTYGFPAPIVGQWTADMAGNWTGGQIVLIGHANAGIVSAGGHSHAQNGIRVYEFNVGWHNGESGGPVCVLDPVSVVALMQANRNIQTPNGIAQGPRIGRALSSVESHLRLAGATIV